MNEVSDYIRHLKQHFNATDEIIVDKLQLAGWTKEDAIKAVRLHALPDAPPAPQHGALPRVSDKAKGGLSALSQAMQHILLWFFSISTTIMLSIVSSALFGSEASSDILSVYVAIAIVTFTPFAFVYVDYLKRYRKNRAVVTGKVWSIITIAVHSLAAIVSGVVLIANLILGPTTVVIVPSITIIAINLIIVATYYQATFGKTSSAFRKICVYALLPLLFTIVSIFGLYSLSKLGPIRADEKLRGRMVQTVDAIREFRGNNNQLPASISSLKNVDTSGVTYKKITDTTYDVCGSFKTKYPYSYNPLGAVYDESVSEYNFRSNKKGEVCTRFSSTDPYNIQNNFNR